MEKASSIRSVNHGTRWQDGIAAACGLAAALAVLLVTTLGGAWYPGYRHIAQYISELGARGAPGGELVNLGGFLPIGMLTVGFVVCGWRSLAESLTARLGLVLFLGVAAGYLIAAFAPCDQGCAGDSPRQLVHNLGGLFEYLGGGAGLLLLAVAFRRSTRWRGYVVPAMVAGVSTLAVLFLLGSGGSEPLRGLWQRIAEAALFGWIALMSLALPGRRRAVDASQAQAPQGPAE
jgi:hypothetical protein